MSFLAFDLGGTRLKAGLVSSEGGRAARSASIPTPGADQVLALLMQTGERLLEGATADGVGLCLPGLVDDGRTIALPGKLDGIVGVDLASPLREAFGHDPVVVNDAIAAGAGEVAFGAGRGAQRVVTMTIGTGVGVTVFEDGRPLGTGVVGGGILGGQIPVGLGGSDTSGRGGTIEALCRAQRIVDLANDAGGSFGSVEDVFRANAADDVAASTGVARYRAGLARALVALAQAHAPDRIVVGGGPVTSDNPLTPGMTDMIAPNLFAGYTVEVRAAQLGDDAALAGLAHLGGAA